MCYATSPSCSAAVLQRQAGVHDHKLAASYLLHTQRLIAGCAAPFRSLLTQPLPAGCRGNLDPGCLPWPAPETWQESVSRYLSAAASAHLLSLMVSVGFGWGTVWLGYSLAGLQFGWGTIWLGYSLVRVSLILQYMCDVCDGTISTGFLHTTR